MKNSDKPRQTSLNQWFKDVFHLPATEKGLKKSPCENESLSIRYYKSRNEFINKSLSFVEYW
ncbi:hypothetical protein I150019B4_03430 [Alistipes putredinis]|jgi:hypothetical protein